MAEWEESGRDDLVVEAALVEALRQAPNNNQVRLNYARWLELRGDLRARYLRTECALQALPQEDTSRLQLQNRLRQLQKMIDRDWQVAVARSPIENCPPQFEFQCPKQWQLLEGTNEATVRFCNACRRQVYFCADLSEAQTRAQRHECVALDSSLLRRSNDLSERPIVMGKLTRIPPVS